MTMFRLQVHALRDDLFLVKQDHQTQEAAVTLRKWTRTIAIVTTLLTCLTPFAVAADADLDSEDQFEAALDTATTDRCPGPVAGEGPTICFDRSNFGGGPIAGAFTGPGGDWGSEDISYGLCCGSSPDPLYGGTTKQRLEILPGADNGPVGATDCRQTPIANLDKYCDSPDELGGTVKYHVGGDVTMADAYLADARESYGAIAWIKVKDVHQPEPGMFRGRLTIHGYAGNTLEQECNAFLRSTEVDGPDGNPLPGTADPDQFVAIEIPDCPMVDTMEHNGLNGTEGINRVDVHVRANAFMNDIASGKVLVHRVIFFRVV